MESALWLITGILLLPLARLGWDYYQNSKPEWRERQAFARLHAMALQLDSQNLSHAAADIRLALVQRYPRTAIAYVVETQLWARCQDYPDTASLVSAYNTLLEQKPEDGSLHFKLGVLLHREGQEAAAREHWQKTLRHSDDGWADQARERLAAG